MTAVIFDKDKLKQEIKDKLGATLKERGAYTAPIVLGKSQAALYLNELMFNATTSFRATKKILATIQAPSLYDVARKINKGDTFLNITTTEDIKYTL